MTRSPLLRIDDLHVSVEGKQVVKGVSLTINECEIHAIMGPNGSGKSSLVNALMGHPRYIVTSGRAQFKGEDLLILTPDERAKRGLFLAFQYPKEIAGVSVRSFLLAAHRARPQEGKRLSPLQFQKLLLTEMATLKMDPSFAERSINQGFSGGEKKKAEILQLKILKPQLALLDETDSGLDVDALRIVAEGVNALRAVRYELRAVSTERISTQSPKPKAQSFSALIVTHYARILDHISPDRVHVMVDGRIAESGGHALALELEKQGYLKYGKGQKISSVKLKLEEGKVDGLPGNAE